MNKKINKTETEGFRTYNWKEIVPEKKELKKVVVDKNKEVVSEEDLKYYADILFPLVSDNWRINLPKIIIDVRNKKQLECDKIFDELRKILPTYFDYIESMYHMMVSPEGAKHALKKNRPRYIEEIIEKLKEVKK